MGYFVQAALEPSLHITQQVERFALDRNQVWPSSHQRRVQAKDRLCPSDAMRLISYIQRIWTLRRFGREVAKLIKSSGMPCRDHDQIAWPDLLWVKNNILLACFRAPPADNATISIVAILHRLIGGAHPFQVGAVVFLLLRRQPSLEQTDGHREGFATAWRAQPQRFNGLTLAVVARQIEICSPTYPHIRCSFLRATQE